MTTKINVLQVIPKLGYGGAETGCYDIAHYLAEKECGSYIATSGGELLKFVKKNRVGIFKIPVHSKNPILIFLNTIFLSFFILTKKINIVHARSRAPAWSCYLACLLTNRAFVTTFHGTYNFNNKLKKFYNSVMLRSNLTIAGSNFIFSHINENYNEYLNKKKKLRVIFRGINIDYFRQKNISVLKQEKLKMEWGLEQNKFTILMPGRLTSWKGQEKLIESLELRPEKRNLLRTNDSLDESVLRFFLGSLYLISFFNLVSISVSVRPYFKSKFGETTLILNLSLNEIKSF